MTVSLHRQEIDKQSFSLFIRDLSNNLNTNLKHMIEDTIQKPMVEQDKQKKNYHKNKKVIKKKDIIIQEQNKIREKKTI